MDKIGRAFFSIGELFGGVERHLLGLCQFLMRQDLDPHVVLFHDRELARQIRALGQEPVILGVGARYSLETPGPASSVLRAESRQVQRERFTLERMGMQFWDLYRESLA